MARFSTTPPIDPLPRHETAADPQVPETVDLPLPVVPVEKFAGHLPQEAEDALDDHTDLLGDL